METGFWIHTTSPRKNCSSRNFCAGLRLSRLKSGSGTGVSAGSGDRVLSITRRDFKASA
jgi:hypothetical protein